MDEQLTTRQVARRQCWPLRTAQRYVAAWATAQHRPHVPRVRVARRGTRGRPGYLTDVASLTRWASASNTNATTQDT